MTADSQHSHVQTLSATVQVVMMGSRQVTMGVYRQLDTVPPNECEPYGRVSDPNDEDGRFDRVSVVGRHRGAGALVRASVTGGPRRSDSIRLEDGYGRETSDWWCEGDDGDEVTWYGDDHRSLCARITDHVDPDDYVSVWLSSSARQLRTWRFTDAASKAAVRQVVAETLASRREQRRLRDEWRALPLIVLASAR